MCAQVSLALRVPLFFIFTIFPHHFNRDCSAISHLASHQHIPRVVIRYGSFMAVLVEEKEVSLAWEPASSVDLLVQQVFVSSDGGNSWQYNAIAIHGPLLQPGAASQKGKYRFSSVL